MKKIKLKKINKIKSGLSDERPGGYCIIFRPCCLGGFMGSLGPTPLAGGDTFSSPTAEARARAGAAQPHAVAAPLFETFHDILSCILAVLGISEVLIFTVAECSES